MSTEAIFTFRAAVTSIAAGVVVVVAFALIRSTLRGGKRVVWEILRATADIICMLLVGLSAHGNIGAWGAWVGFGGAVAVLLITLYVSRSVKKTAHGSSPKS